MSEKHDLSWAVGTMRSGHRVQRQGWDNTTTMFMRAEEESDQWLWYVSIYVGSRRKQWTILEVDIEDVMADDWMIAQ